MPSLDLRRLHGGTSGLSGGDHSNDLDHVLRAEVAVARWDEEVRSPQRDRVSLLALAWPWHGLGRMYCRMLCQDWRFQALTTCLTVFALVGDDARLLLTSREADTFFNLLIVLAFLIFALEIAAASVGTRGYFNGFFFYLD